MLRYLKEAAGASDRIYEQPLQLRTDSITHDALYKTYCTVQNLLLDQLVSAVTESRVSVG